MKSKKSQLKKRISNRQYPVRRCKKIDCKMEYIPSDNRQVYCCDQHRIDSNNDKRKIKILIEIVFSKIVKKNRDILIKIYSSAFYKDNNYVHKTLLDYEDYDFNVNHRIIINKQTGREVHICYDYGLELLDSEKQIFSIKHILDYEF
jgi:hypothetical protein